MNLNTIHCGDCIQGLQQVPAGSIDLAFADPPFNIGYQYDVYDDKKQASAYLDWTRQWLAGVCRALKPDGTFWIAIGDEYAAEIKVIATGELGLTCRSWVIWYYTFGVHCTRKFTRSHAHLFHFVKDPSRFTFNEDAVAVPSARQLVYADSRADPRGRMPDDTWVLRPQDLPSGFAALESTWYFPRVAGTFKERSGFHGCQMPEQLLGRIIRASSNPDEIVLDPFAGSGTTLAVAKKLGRCWLGFELSPDYARQATARIAAVDPGQPLEGAAEPVMSAPRTGGVSDKVWLRAGVRRALVEAFLAASAGWSSERVIADPELNARYCDQCRDLGLPGRPVDWNQALVRMRKSGQLKGLPKVRRTHFSETELDEFLFAGEIALRLRSDETGLSLDDILCDPGEAQKLDEVARRFAPGFTPLQYRWAALTLRKQTHAGRQRARTLPKELVGRRLQFAPPGKTGAVADGPGVYLARLGEEQPLYVGATLDLRRFVREQLQTAGWRQAPVQLEFGHVSLPSPALEHRHGLKSRLVARYAPAWNYLGPRSPG